MKVASPGLYLLENDDRERLQALIQKHGLAATVRKLGVSRGAVLSVVAGTGIRRGSAEMIVVALAREESSK